MSHMSVMRSSVTMKSKDVLEHALKSLVSQLAGFNYVVEGTTVRVEYPAIQQYRSRNLSYVWNGREFEAHGDPYLTNGKLHEVTHAIEVQYRRSGVERAVSKCGSPIKSKIKNGIRIKVMR